MRKLSSLLLLCLISALPLYGATAAELAAQGRAALQRDEHEKAVDLLEKAIKLEPNNAQHHYYLGAAYGEMAQSAGMLKQASLAKKTKAEFERAVQLDPNFLDARMGLVDYYSIAPGFMGGSMDKAREQAAEIKKRDLLQGARAFARIHAREKKIDLARKEYVDAVRAMPNSAKAHYFLGAFLLSEKNFAGGLHEIEMALKLDPNFMPGYYRLGHYSAMAEKDYARGEEALRKYLTYKPADNEPSHANAWYFLGMIYEKQGRKADAKKAFVQAQKLAPKSKEINEALKRVS
jgi:tetratricopeptide (TPR) repeat protein